jgi:hypothetical protein
MNANERQTPVVLHGMEALEAALRDPSTAIYRRRWTGKVELVDRATACRQALNGGARVLFVELNAQ